MFYVTSVDGWSTYYLNIFLIETTIHRNKNYLFAKHFQLMFYFNQ